MRRDRNRRILCAAGISLPFALCLVLGYQLEKTDHLTPGIPALAAFLVLATACTVLTALSFRIPLPSPAAVRNPDSEKGVSVPVSPKEENGRDFRFFLLAWLLIALPCLIVLLGVYPGFFVYDAQDELMEVVTRTFHTHHPLLHVLALGGVIAGVHKFTGSWNLGIFLYLLLQMLLITGIYAHIITRLKKAGFPRVLQIIFTLWFGCFPTIVMYTLCSTKDGLFTAFTTLFLWTFAEILSAHSCSKRQGSLLLCCAVLMMLLRNNASYVLLAFALLLALSLLWNRFRNGGSRNSRMKISFVMVSIVIISYVMYSASNAALITITHASHNEHQEKISVAIQSLGRMYTFHPESFTAEDQAILFSYLPEEGLAHYELRDVDLLKSTFNNDRYSSDSLSFWKLWLKMTRKHPGTFLTSWLLTSCGMWYPFAVQNVYQGHTVFTFTYTESSYFGYETELPGIRQSLIPPIDALYRWLSLDATIQRIPLLSLLFAPAFWFWVFVWFAARALYEKKGSMLLPLVPLFLLWLTYLIGPYALVRYALPFFTCIPILFYLSMIPSETDRTPSPCQSDQMKPDQ